MKKDFSITMPFELDTDNINESLLKIFSASCGLENIFYKEDIENIIFDDILFKYIHYLLNHKNDQKYYLKIMYEFKNIIKKIILNNFKISTDKIIKVFELLITRFIDCGDVALICINLTECLKLINKEIDIDDIYDYELKLFNKLSIEKFNMNDIIVMNNLYNIYNKIDNLEILDKYLNKYNCNRIPLKNLLFIGDFKISNKIIKMLCENPNIYKLTDDDIIDIATFPPIKNEELLKIISKDKYEERLKSYKEIINSNRKIDLIFKLEILNAIKKFNILNNDEYLNIIKKHVVQSYI